MHIKHLILKGNPISTFDPSIFMKMKRLERLYLDDTDEACWSTKGWFFSYQNLVSVIDLRIFTKWLSDLLKFAAAAQKLKLKLQIN